MLKDARNDYVRRPLEGVPRSYFCATENVNQFILNLQEYILYNSIPDENIYLQLKFSFKGNALLWL